MPQEITETTKKDSWLDLIKFGIMILAIVIPFRIFIAQPYIVEGASMDPTFKNGDYLIVDQISYRFEPPTRGAVIILKYPKDPSKNFIKRVIGFPGETVSINAGIVSIINSTGTIKLDEPYIKLPKTENFQMTLKDSEYFVMGDNRAGSSDSRYWGPLPKEDIVGRPLIRLLPISNMGTFPGNYYNEAKTE
jgi:signal peptidase I